MKIETKEQLFESEKVAEVIPRELAEELLILTKNKIILFRNYLLVSYLKIIR